MPGALPLVEDGGSTPSLWSFGSSASASVAGTQASGSVSAGTPAEGGAENAHLWVAGVMLAALAGIVFFHIGGFRFAADAGVTGR